VPSLLAAIGGIIERHMLEIGFLKAPVSLNTAPAVGDDTGPKRSACPRCGERALVFQEGCATCLSCGFSKCS
jgi:ribonucleoside-diphosphate reductase alpha chain